MEVLNKQQEAWGAIAEKDGEYREAIKQVHALHAGEIEVLDSPWGFSVI